MEKDKPPNILYPFHCLSTHKSFIKLIVIRTLVAPPIPDRAAPSSPVVPSLDPFVSGR